MQDIDVKGVKVPALGFGTWALSGRDAYDATRTALALGYRHIDTAQIYGNESEIGRAIRDSGIPRREIFLVTKVPPMQLHAGPAKRSHDESLQRLGFDYVDLLLIHWPNAQVPLAETLGALAELRIAGKTRFIGVSNFTVALLREAVEREKAELLCNQVEYHPFLSQRPLLAMMKRYGMMLTAYAPIARGRVFRDRTLAAIGRKYGKSAGQVALRWLIEQDRVGAVPKAAKREHAAANIEIFDFALSAEDRTAIGALAQGGRLVEWGGYSPKWDVE
ncbi:MAG TPA: aldo/keto reductase [Stellaceae bacterium]|nr:aldo/keto reductase [Stellaceae bacterium]